MNKDEHIVASAARHILSQIHHVVVGKNETLMWTLAAILARGHVLLEDIPGVGKTTMALSFSKTLNLDYGRVQFTPDVLPSDVTGYSILNQADGRMVYQPGAVLCNLFLADELNRATSRTQSALLEAMEEGQVTVDGTAHVLPQPFVVIATQNPTGAAGTQMLPDSQMDRFTIRMSLGYPDQDNEVAMVLNRQGSNPMDALRPLLTKETLVTLQDTVANTYINEAVVRYIVALVTATRNHDDLQRGASPRATLSVTAVAKAVAQLRGRDYVTPRDVQEVFLRTVGHRLLLTAEAESRGVTADAVLEEILKTVPAPKAN